MSEEYKRQLPTSKLDFEQMRTDPVWGVGRIPRDLKEKLEAAVKEEDGEKLYENLWELHGWMTRDLRLGNLGVLNNELEYCVYYAELAADMLMQGHIRAFSVCLSRIATRIELSQSKKGWFRKEGQTERYSVEEKDNEEKTGFMGLGSKKELE